MVTLKNEEDCVRDFIESILSQSRLPDEFIIVDGGSTDNTTAIIQKIAQEGRNIRLIVKQGNRSVGRNAGIIAAQSEVVASTDAGSIVDPLWLEEIIKPFQSLPRPDVVGGITLPLTTSLFEACVGVINLPEAIEIDPDNFLPSSRSAAFTKEIWLKAGKYPEVFDWNEDTVFDIELKKRGAKFAFNPKAIVLWRPPGNFRALFKQFFNYARGDGQAGIYFRKFYWPKKYLPYLLATLLILAGIKSWIFLYLLTIFILFYMTKPAAKTLRRTSRYSALVLLLCVIFVRDIAEMFGYVFGVFERGRIRNR